MNQTVKQGAKTKRSSTPVVILLIFIILLALLAGLYYMASRYYANRFPNGTTINGIDVSNMTVDNVKERLNDQTQGYSLTISERDGGKEIITAAQIDMRYDDNGDVDRLHDQYDPLLWVMYYFADDELTAGESTVYDEAKLDQVIAGLNCLNPANITKAQDASLQHDDKSFFIQEEVMGNEPDEEKVKAAIIGALTTNQPELDLDQAQVYKAPKIYKDDEKLTKELDKVNVWLGAEITYDFEDNRIEKADASVIVDWLTQNDKGSWSLDRDKVFEWVKKNLAYKYDTFGLTHEVTTHDGKKITLKGGDYGWCLARNDTTDALLEAVKASKKETLEPAYQYTAKNRGKDDIGGTYVEVSLEKQKLWLYKDYECILETDVVTGNPNKGNATPSGSVWAFDCHKSPAVLGTMETMGYSSHVDFWMSFTGNVGLHNANGWRSKFGGDIYKTNGSHGCVNMTYEAAELCFKTINVGYPVFVY